LVFKLLVAQVPQSGMSSGPIVERFYVIENGSSRSLSIGVLSGRGLFL